MSSRKRRILDTWDCPGFGRVTTRPLSRGRVKQIWRLDDLGDRIIEVIRRGLVEPAPDELTLLSGSADLEAVWPAATDLATGILARSGVLARSVD